MATNGKKLAVCLFQKVKQTIIAESMEVELCFLQVKFLY